MKKVNHSALKLTLIIALATLGLSLSGCPDFSHQRPAPDYENMRDAPDDNVEQ